MPAVPAANFVVRYPDARFISAPEGSANVSKERPTVYHMAALKKRLYHPEGNSPGITRKNQRPDRGTKETMFTTPPLYERWGKKVYK